MADWAQRLAVDVKTIQRLFVRQTGMSFGQWRQQARLLRALELLATGEKVIDVALALGMTARALSPPCSASSSARHLASSLPNGDDYFQSCSCRGLGSLVNRLP